MPRKKGPKRTEMINLRMRLDQLADVEAIREHDERTGPSTASVTRTAVLDELLTRGVESAKLARGMV